MNYPDPIRLEETASTNSYLADLCRKASVTELTSVYTDFQTAGRGQRGNSWESEAGKNLLFSFVVYPDFLEARRQFFSFAGYGYRASGGTVAIRKRHNHQVAERYLLARQKALRNAHRK